MTPLLLFVHGWGFDASLWDRIRSSFAPGDTLAWDLGFFGAPSRPQLPAGRAVIAVGHSFGLLWLLQERPVPYQALIAINGFSRFARKDDFQMGVPPLLLARMRARLGADAAGVVKNFRAQCGVTTPLPADPAIAPLDAGLEALQNWDARPCRIDMALCGETDSLVSPAMSRACFPAGNMHWHQDGHMLPLTAPDWCAGKLRECSEALT